MWSLRILAVLCLLLGVTGATYAAEECKLTGDQMPGDENLCHSTFHEPYKKMWFEVNASALSIVPPDKLDQLHEFFARVSADGSQPGDYGYKSGDTSLNELYRLLYKGTKCNCKYGSCRPTKVRAATAGEASESGYMVYINRAWYPVPKNAIMLEKDVPPDLWAQLMGPLLNSNGELNGHTCALASQPPHQECTFVPRMGF